MSDTEAAALEQKVEKILATLGDSEGGLFSGGFFERMVERHEAGFMVAVEKRTEGREGRAIRRLFNGSRWVRRMAASEAVALGAAKLGEEEILAKDGIAFLEFILEHWEEIFAIIQQIISLFSV